jgi:hypothetical protein
MHVINLRTLLWLLFVRNWFWKLLSLAIAILIYYSIRAEISDLRTIAVPILGDGCVVTSTQPQVVYVTLRGSATELEQLYTPAVHFTVKRPSQPRDAKEAIQLETIRLKPSALRQIGRLRVARIEPSLVNVQFECPVPADPLTPPDELDSVSTNNASTPSNAIAPPEVSVEPITS